MRLTDLARIVLLLLALIVAVGCRRSADTGPGGSGVVAQPLSEPATDAPPSSPAEPEPADETAPTSAPEPEPVAGGKNVKIKGYINVSSGCQQETVDLLKRMDRQSDRISLELIDFGQSEGSRRWRKDGFSCMTILINGHQTVTYGKPGSRKIITFQYPPGFQWIPSDLEAAAKAALAGTIHYGEEPGAKKVQSRMPKLRITSREAVLGGKKVGEVLINGKVAIRLRTTYDGLPPLQRAERAAARLKRALARGFTPSQLRPAEVGNEIGVAAADKVICIADKPQAKALGMTPEALAKGWVTSLKKALSAAMSAPAP